MDAKTENSLLLADYVTERGLAKEFRRNPRTIYRWRVKRTGPPVTYLGRQPLYNMESAREWLRTREQHITRRR